MEPDRGCFRVAAGQGAEPRERLLWPRLVETADGVRDECFRVRRGEPGGRRELVLRRDRPLEPLQGHAVEQLRSDVVAAGVSRQGRDLPGRW